MTEIRVITENKKQYLPLFLEADPDEGMIDRYLEQGAVYLLSENSAVLAVAVVADLGDGRCELKNIATDPDKRGKGHGSALLRAVIAAQEGKFFEMLVGTSAPMLPFYRRHGFCDSHVCKHFFTDNYPEPIFEDGVQCIDMLYLKRRLAPCNNM